MFDGYKFAPNYYMELNIRTPLPHPSKIYMHHIMLYNPNIHSQREKSILRYRQMEYGMVIYSSADRNSLCELLSVSSWMNFQPNRTYPPCVWLFARCRRHTSICYSTRNAFAANLLPARMPVHCDANCHINKPCRPNAMRSRYQNFVVYCSHYIS